MAATPQGARFANPRQQAKPPLSPPPRANAESRQHYPDILKHHRSSSKARQKLKDKIREKSAAIGDINGKAESALRRIYKHPLQNHTKTQKSISFDPKATRIAGASLAFYADRGGEAESALRRIYKHPPPEPYKTQIGYHLILKQRGLQALRLLFTPMAADRARIFLNYSFCIASGFLLRFRPSLADFS